MKRFVLVLAAASVGAAALAGCSSSSTTSTGTPGTAASASSGTTPRTDPPRTDPPRTAPPATSRPSGTALDADSAFCTQLRKVDQQSKANSAGGTTSEADITAFVTELDALAQVAPGDLADDIRTIAATLEKIAPLSDHPEDTEKLLEIITDPKVQAASKAVEDAALTECGLDLDITGSGSGSGPTNTPGGATSPGSIKGAGYACDQITPSFDKDETDPTSIYRVKKGMCESGPAGSWGSTVFDHASWSSSGSDPAAWEIVVTMDRDPKPSFGSSEAVEVCKTMATYLTSVGSGASTITVSTGSSSSTDSTPLARKSETGSCAAA